MSRKAKYIEPEGKAYYIHNPYLCRCWMNIDRYGGNKGLISVWQLCVMSNTVIVVAVRNHAEERKMISLKT